MCIQFFNSPQFFIIKENKRKPQTRPIVIFRSLKEDKMLFLSDQIAALMRWHLPFVDNSVKN